MAPVLACSQAGVLQKATRHSYLEDGPLREPCARSMQKKADLGPQLPPSGRRKKRKKNYAGSEALPTSITERKTHRAEALSVLLTI